MEEMNLVVYDQVSQFYKLWKIILVLKYVC